MPARPLKGRLTRDRWALLLLRRCSIVWDNLPMKTAYELAMERLSKASPATKISDAQKKKLAELDAKYAAKIAEREIFLKDELGKAAAKGDFEAVEQLEKQIVSEKKSLTAELEEKKDEVRKERTK